MAAITPDRFDPIKAFCNVRLQQGVPLVDADVNELDDIRKFEVRAFLKWFVGDGVPSGNDGFRIDAAATPAADDLQIRIGAQATPASPGAVGPALRNFGRCIVDGLDVIIQKDTTYKGQPLFAAAAFGVPQVAPIPNVPGQVLVYIDVWERLVAPSEDASLIVPPLGTESCARIKREWVIRARVGTSVPVPGDPDFSSDNKHSYYGLARITRRLVGGVPAPILPSDITDVRDRGLLIAPATLIPDVLGGTASDYRRGMNRPVMSLRDTINTLLLGELPGTPDAAIAPSGTSNDSMTYAVVFDLRGGANVLWASDRSGTQQIFAARLDPANPGAGFTLPAQPQVTSGPTSHMLPHAVVLPTGDILTAYTASPPTGQFDVFFKRATDVSSLSAAAEQPVTGPSSPTGNIHPFVVVVPAAGGGGMVVFFYFNPTASSSIGRWLYRRRQYQADWAEATATWADATGVALAATAATSAPFPSGGSAGGFHAAVGTDGNVWVAYEAMLGTSTQVIVQPVRLTPADGTVVVPQALTVAGSAVSRNPFVVIDNSGTVWIFVPSTTASGTFLQQYVSATAAPVGTLTAVPGTTQNALAPTAAVDAQNGVWLFWRSSDFPTRVLSLRWSPSMNAWGAARPVPSSPGQWGSDYALFVTRGPTGTLWLFRQRAGTTAGNTLLFRQIITTI